MSVSSPAFIRRRRSIPAVVAALLGFLVLVPSAASAERRVIGDIHTDAISTFLDDGRLVLATAADVPEGAHTRLDPAKLVYRVDDDAIEALPSGFEFIGPVGSRPWVAPMTRRESVIWPGVSTEGVPKGAIDQDRTDLTLVSVEGPGDFEMYTTGAFGQASRLWSSDDPGFERWSIGRAHKHMNWAFTEPGVYDLTVRADVTRSGAPQSATATYRFHVGPEITPAATSTSLAASSAEIAEGDPVTLTATVTPAAEGEIEFRDGAEVIGRDDVSDGKASLTTAGLDHGTRSLTATFFSDSLLHADSTSSAVPVRVRPILSVSGLKAVYTAGEVLRATATGVTLAQGQAFEWRIRPAGATHAGEPLTGTGQQAALGTLEQRMDPSLRDYELAVRLVRGPNVVRESPWERLDVMQTAAPLTATWAGDSLPAHLGDRLAVRATGRSLEPGETIRIVQRIAGRWAPLTELTYGAKYADAGPFGDPRDVRQEGDTFVFEPSGVLGDHRAGPFRSSVNFDGEFAVQTVRAVLDGRTVRHTEVVSQSAPIPVRWNLRAAEIQGMRTIYRPGDTLALTGTVSPTRPGLRYGWYTDNSVCEVPGEQGLSCRVFGTEDPQAIRYSRQLKLEDNGLSVELRAYHYYPDGRILLVAASKRQAIVVTDAPPGDTVQMLALGGHYHQGDTIRLRVGADPELQPGDRVDWAWRFPGEETWRSMPRTSGLERDVIAEQGLDGVAVRATIHREGGGSKTSNAETIYVDDHGEPAVQVTSIEGVSTYATGETVRLVSKVAPATELDDRRWFKQGPGDANPVPIAGAKGAELTFTASAEDDGRRFFVEVVKPDGKSAYPRSEPVTLDVSS